MLLHTDSSDSYGKLEAGMKTRSWFAGLMLMFVAVGIVAHNLGGLEVANTKVMKIEPALVSAAGKGGFFTWQSWFGLLLLWFFSVPMFPQVFMRFFTPKHPRALQMSAIAYPLITSVLFLCPVIIGVLGHLAHPGLVGKASDQILPMMLKQFARPYNGLQCVLFHQRHSDSSRYCICTMVAVYWLNSALSSVIICAAFYLNMASPYPKGIRHCFGNCLICWKMEKMSCQC